AEAPDFLARGFVHDDATFEPVIPVIEKTLATAAEEGVGDARQLEQLVARAVANWAFHTHRRKPLIIPVIIDA
ncbi:RNase J family beta-CASP ribonuclease, partial [Streptomyces sp. NPDC017179]